MNTVHGKLREAERDCSNLNRIVESLRAENAALKQQVEQGKLDTVPEDWVRCASKLPSDETPVLIIRNGEIQFGERRWEYPSFEDSYKAFWYWDDPYNDGQDWEDNDVTHWMPLPAAPKQEK